MSELQVGWIVGSVVTGMLTVLITLLRERF